MSWPFDLSPRLCPLKPKPVIFPVVIKAKDVVQVTTQAGGTAARAWTLAASADGASLAEMEWISGV